MSKMSDQITIVKMNDSLFWKGKLEVPPSNPKDGWVYYNIKDKNTYIYNEIEARWEPFSQSAIEIVNIITYFYAQIKGGGQPNPPTTNPPPATWTEGEPQDFKGKEVYSIDLITYGDGSYNYGEVKRAFIYDTIDDNIQNTEANSYQIETNQGEVLKFISKRGDKEKTTFSPGKLTFEVIQNLKEGKKNLQNYSYEIQIDGTDVKAYAALDESTKSIVTLDLQDFITKQFPTEKAAEKWVQDSLLKNSVNAINFQYLKNGKIVRQKTVLCRFGISQEGAKLNVNAADINAAIQSTSMTFSANGLQIKNGGFKILDSKDKEVFKTDTNGNLDITGIIHATDGEFSGELKAASGTFIGDISAATGTFKGGIEAKTGKIGGFNIERGQLTSDKKSQEGLPFIILNGEEGKITAENMELGNGVRIRDYLQLGENVKLQNPKTIGDDFLVVKNKGLDCLNFSSNGIISIGGKNADTNHIIINGPEGYISSSNFGEGTVGWKISNLDSVFNNVNIRGSIKACVLEYGTVQAVGGMLLVRPSTIIKQMEKGNGNLTFYLENLEGFEKDDYCMVEQGEGISAQKVYYQITEKGSDFIKVSGSSDEGLDGKPIVNLGKRGSVGIGINATTQDFFVPPQSISVFDFDYNRSSKIIPHIILGKLPNEDIYGYAKGTYGLYAENVLLRGSLVTQAQIDKDNPTYSGISTIYKGSEAPTSHEYDRYFRDEEGNSTAGEILLWAGARGTKKTDIEKSKFFVDKNGNLFAGSGYFKGTIITDAKITASELQTAIITGSINAEGKPALTIKNTNNGEGILFTNDKADNASGLLQETIFKVSDKKLEANVNEVIFNQNFRVNEKGSMILDDFYITDRTNILPVAEKVTGIQALTFGKSQISFLDNFSEKESTGIIQSYINFKKGITMSADGGKTKAFVLNSDKLEIKTEALFEKNIRYGDKMEYKPAYQKDQMTQINKLIGYDLYIS